MKTIKLLLTITILSFLSITGCKEDSRITPGFSQARSQPSARQSVRLSPELKAKLDKLRASLPADCQKRIENQLTQLTKHHSEYTDIIRQALKAVEPTSCDDNTPLHQWLGNEMADWSDDALTNAIMTGMLYLPFYDAWVFENSSANQYFGTRGEYTQQITKSYKDLQRFWPIQTEDIKLVAMHGSMLKNHEKLIRVYNIVYGFDMATAESLADAVSMLLKEFPQYKNGDHPIFSFNAFAYEAMYIEPWGGAMPAKIAMGDGMLDAYTAIGFGDVAPQALLAHEFGHHIQFQLGVYTNIPEDMSGPEFIRRTELMADAYSAYYLSHARGAAMQWKRVQQFLQVFFNIGDCMFDYYDHHGTPTQRMAAAEWAYRLADNTQKQGKILTPREFLAIFDAQLPVIVQQ